MAYSVALLVSDSYANGLSVSMYGWDRGVIAERGYHVLGAPADASIPLLPAPRRAAGRPAVGESVCSREER
jgi:hypothetical protein